MQRIVVFLYSKIFLSIICNKRYFYNQCRSVEPSADLSCTPNKVGGGGGGETRSLFQSWGHGVLPSALTPLTKNRPIINVVLFTQNPVVGFVTPIHGNKRKKQKKSDL